MNAYLVERYVPDSSPEQVRDSTARLDAAGREITREGIDAAYLGSTYLPADEAVLDVFLAPSIDVISEINQRAGIAVARAIEAILIAPAGPHGRANYRRSAAPTSRKSEAVKREGET